MDKEAALQKLEEAERRLNEVPLTILSKLEEVIVVHSFDRVAKALAVQAEFVGRMRRFMQASSKPISLRIFTRQAGGLYVVAKVEGAALAHIQVGDPFLLLKKSPTGLETPSARLAVHQPPDLKKGVVMFHIAHYLSDEMGHLDSLAQTGNINGIKGYGVRIASTMDRYEDVDFENLAVAIPCLIQDILQYPKV